MYLQDSLVVLLVSTGSLMYQLSTVHHVESSFDLAWDWLILSLSGKLRMSFMWFHVVS